MNATQRKRLLKLADFIVEQVPDEKFDMCRYGGWGLNTDPNIGCTSGCALAWATVMFRKLGVFMADEQVPAYKERLGFGVGVALFGLTYDQSEAMFSSAKSWKTAKQVRRDIIRFVAKLDKAKLK